MCTTQYQIIIQYTLKYWSGSLWILVDLLGPGMGGNAGLASIVAPSDVTSGKSSNEMSDSSVSDNHDIPLRNWSNFNSILQFYNEDTGANLLQIAPSIHLGPVL